ncbi:MAG: hypothetical protein QNJ12_10170 [Ilumatobacter sp.]|uniref:hypothetical protein n=1 Tax=Ilumatobacter sp. TaxID=1967498 RepID=UPI00261ADD13|nr:hypothetical protein [Ilumatobacter sp.]MDJ0769152.1 hypothetical protein [Ilumatobacter sp.]
MRHQGLLTALLVGSLALAACGGDDGDEAEGDTAAADDATGADDATDDVTEDATGDQPGADDVAGDQAVDDGGDASRTTELPPIDDAPAASPTNGSATLTLVNGESYEFSILCALEPQEAAGSEILFSVTSYDDIGLDITQFGSSGTITDMATISVYDESLETLWEAGTLYESFGGSIVLTLDGSTVRASASFYPGGDVAARPVEGDIVANC